MPGFIGPSSGFIPRSKHHACMGHIAKYVQAMRAEPKKYEEPTDMARLLSGLVSYVKDRTGHEHASKGPHGGQFVSSGNGGKSSATEKSSLPSMSDSDLHQAAVQAKQIAMYTIISLMVGGGIALLARSAVSGAKAAGSGIASGVRRIVKGPQGIPHDIRLMPLYCRETGDLSMYGKDDDLIRDKEGKFASAQANRASKVADDTTSAAHQSKKREDYEAALARHLDAATHHANAHYLHKEAGNDGDAKDHEVAYHLHGKVAALLGQKSLPWWKRSQFKSGPVVKLARGIAEMVHYVKDASGHEHKGKGEGGGQFTSSGNGDSLLSPKGKGHKAYVVNSRLGGWLPKIFALHHRSICTCPPGEKITIVDGKTVKTNPNCKCFSTFPSSKGAFVAETQQRVGASVKPIETPVSSVMKQMENWEHRPYRLLSSNCQHAVDTVVKMASKAHRLNQRRGDRVPLHRAITEICSYVKDRNGIEHDSGGRFSSSGGGPKGSKLQDQTSVKGFGKKLAIIGGSVGIAAAVAALADTLHYRNTGHSFVKKFGIGVTNGLMSLLPNVRGAPSHEEMVAKRRELNKAAEVGKAQGKIEGDRLKSLESGTINSGRSQKVTDEERESAAKLAQRMGLAFDSTVPSVAPKTVEQPTYAAAPIPDNVKEVAKSVVANMVNPARSAASKKSAATRSQNKAANNKRLMEGDYGMF